MNSQNCQNSQNLEPIRLLREKTGAGLMDCRQALTAAGGDVEQAIAALREKGFEVAARKATRVAVEGIAHASVLDGRAALVEVNTETDFASGHADFAAGTARIAEAIARHRPADLAALMACPADPAADSAGPAGLTDPSDPAAVPAGLAREAGVAAATNRQTVGDLLQRMVLTFRENVLIRRFAILEGPWLFAYMHQNGRYGVILSLSAAGSPEDAAARREDIGRLGRELTLQIAAMAPRLVSRDRLEAAEIAAIRDRIEADIAADESLAGKPAAVRARIASGRLEKYFADFALLEQRYLRDDTLTVGAWLARETAGWPVQVGVAAFERFARGEGLGGDESSPSAFARQLAGA